MPSASVSFTGSVSGGDLIGGKYRVTFGKDSMSSSVGIGLGIGYGGSITIVHTIKIWPNKEYF